MNRNGTKALPSSYNELMIYVAYNASSDFYYPFHIIKGFQNHGWIMGYTTGSYCQITTTNNVLTLFDIRVGGTQLSSVTVVGFYR